MNSIFRIMANKRFGYFILACFTAATLLLLIIQYNFSGNMDKMLRGNEKLMKELRTSNHLREIDRDILGVESRIRAAIATDDTSHLEGVDAKIKAVMVYLDSINLGERDQVTEKYLRRLSVLAGDKLRIKNTLIKRFSELGNMNDTSLIANPHARMISDEITSVTHKIYDSRQKKMIALSQTIVKGSRKAKTYGYLLTVFMFFSGGILCWFVFTQFRQQNELIFKLNSSEQTSREALRVKENFLANMSHEIRTPLNAILGFTNLLRRREHDASSAEFIDSIEKAGENLMAIINDILDLSKIEAGMMRIVVAPFSVRGLTQSIETLFKEKVKEKGLSLRIVVAADVPDTLLGDATRLTQILVNLIGNAIKFSDKGVIDLSFYKRSFTNDTLRLGVRVSDTGIGISPEKLSRIFERFNQAEDSITRNYGGTGLGLSIVKTLIQLQEGSIEVKSEPALGTTFDFFIPYSIAAEQFSCALKLNEESIRSFVNPSLQLLVVDDNVMNQSLMKHLLEQRCLSYTMVSNGVEALEALQEKSFDVILMDIQMPRMDGYTATRHIREELQLHIPIIAMTAHAMAGEREKCISHGMSEYISKPIDEELLFRLISRLVEERPGRLFSGSLLRSPVRYQTIDTSYMKSISKGNLKYEKTVTEQFISCVPEDISGLFQAYEKQDIVAMNDIAHNMKTTVAIMGLLPNMAGLLDQLENVREAVPETAQTLAKLREICQAALEEAGELNRSFND
jgi:signal transduction histidine kinase/CheY-like chemotaxis protein